MNKGIKTITGLAFVGAFFSTAQAADLSPAKKEFFETRVRPVLAQNCFKCHSKANDMLKGGLTLDTAEGLSKGGDSGPAVVPGKPQNSLLVKAIQYHDEDLLMPPKKKMDDAQIRDLTAWVIMGAPFPAGAAAASYVYDEGTLNHWAFTEVKKPSVPVVKHMDWVQTDIDAFVAKRLEEKEMEPGANADKRALLRRVSFDLVGLPPTPDQVEAFVSDTSPNAYQKVVDRLMKSKHFGEKWGRHWLDVARFSETKGDANRREVSFYPYAWTYRDYVINAFNDDKPYNQFVMEQIAADHIFQRAKKKDPSSLAGLGLLTLGNRFDGQREEIINDRIDTITKGFQGMTVSCARCHDHKFDPIPQADYYSLRGILISSMEPEDLPMIETPKETKEYRAYLTERQKRVNDLNKFYDEDVNKWLAKQRKHSGTYLLAIGVGGSDRDMVNKILANNKELNGDDRRYGLGMWRQVINASRNRRNHLNTIFKPWHEFAKLPKNNFGSKAIETAKRLAGDRGINPRVAREFTKAIPRNMGQVAKIYSDLFIKAEEMMEREKKVRPKSTRLRDDYMEALRGIAYMVNTSRDPDMTPFDRIDRFLPRRIQGRETNLRSRIASLDSTHVASPARAMVMIDRAKGEESPIFIRGEARNRGELVPRQFLKIVAKEGERRPYSVTQSGRLELANEIARKDNPLTARVMVNRIWQHLFGEGFVPTPDDLGTQADDPSHPDLINWMAHTFMHEDNWSVKKTIRRVVMSNVYKQTSANNPRYAQIDPNNRLLWRANIRRLDFEALRDSLLVIGGNLDRSTGGKSFDLQDENSRRRTVYAKIDRARLPEVLNHFDFANPDMTTGKRYETTVPQQALFMMNSPLVVELARKLVDRQDFKALETEEDRVKMLYELIFQRLPDEKDVQLGLSYLHATEDEVVVKEAPQQSKAKKGRNNRNQPKKRAPLDAWSKYAHALLQTNEASFIN